MFMISNTQQISMKSAVVLNDDLNGGCNLQVLILRMTINYAIKFLITKILFLTWSNILG